MKYYLAILTLAAGLIYGCASREHDHGYGKLPAAQLRSGDAYFITRSGRTIKVDPTYDRNCASCHGTDGRKNTDLTCSSYTESAKGDPFLEFEKTVRKGNDRGMTAFPQLSDREIRDLFGYFKVLYTVHFEETVGEGRVR